MPIDITHTVDLKVLGGLSLSRQMQNHVVSKNVDEKIKEAIARGEFDNLPGRGKPLDLDAYFATPEHLRMGYSILKNADIIPERRWNS